MNDLRYAIYFVPEPESDLYRFGSATIGYDCYRGADFPRLSVLESEISDWKELTREPRNYGFHATLKAPFRLIEAADEHALRAALDRLAGEFDAAPSFAPEVDLIDDFVAIVPDRLPLALAELANTCVKAFEPFRASLSEQDRQRRLATGLNAQQIAYLDRWGYPYVFEEFRFHMTLTGRLPPERALDIRMRLSTLFRQAMAMRPIAVDRIALLRQAAPGARFEVVRVAPVGRVMQD